MIFPQPKYYTHPYSHAYDSAGPSRSHMQWCPPPMIPTYPMWNWYLQMWMPYPPMQSPVDISGWGAPRISAFQRLESSPHDQADATSDQTKIETATSPKLQSPTKRVWQAKKSDEVKEVSEKEERTTAKDVIQIGTNQVVLGGDFNGPITIGDQVDMIISTDDPKLEEDGKTEKDNSKYFMPRWCPTGSPALKSASSNVCGRRRCKRKSKRSNGTSCSTR